MFLFQKYTTPLLLIVWFWVWGICPWNTSSKTAQTAEAAHVDHGHQPVEDTHHASKGTEHSCAGSGAYSSHQNLMKIGWLQLHDASFHNLIFGAAPVVHQTDGLLATLLQRTVLPKLLTKYYQLYSVYRI